MEKYIISPTQKVDALNTILRIMKGHRANGEKLREGLSEDEKKLYDRSMESLASVTDKLISTKDEPDLEGLDEDEQKAMASVAHVFLLTQKMGMK